MEDFITYELAVKLKDKGYPQHIADDAYITDNEYEDEQFEVGSRYYIPFIPEHIPTIAAPLISEVLKWLRKEKIYVYPHYLPNNDAWMCFMYNVAEQRMYTVNGYNDYEQSAIAGINYVLDNLI